MRLTVLFLSLFIGVIASAQGTLKGKISDTTGKQPLGLATVTIFKAADTALITYRLSTPDGEFRIPGLPVNLALRAVISFSGYSVHRHEFTLTPDQTLDLGMIQLSPEIKSLEEILLLSERPPVMVRKDTIEFNASSFKTLPTALVEDLLKKLPGVQVDAEGNIVVNGKRVNRILVDGKEFFGQDPKMATRNLPANMIDKIQVTDDKDEAELNPDKNKGEIGQVINLKLKKGVKKGWFGKAYAGYGTNNRYEAGSIVNLFRDTMQLSLLGFSNNVNRAGFGFNDIRTLGGFDRSGINMMMVNSNGGINVNGISFGGTGEGINRSSGTGFNMNHVLKNGFTLNTQYFFGHTRNDILELHNRKQFLGDTTFTTQTRRDEVLKTDNHRFGFGLKGKIDSLTRFEFKPSLVLAEQGSNRMTNLNNENNVDGLLNTSLNYQQIRAKDVGYNHNLMLFKNFRKKGRSLNFTNTVSFNDVNNDQVNDVLNNFYNNGSMTMTEIDQLRDRMQKNLSVNANANYTEPISKTFNLRAGYSLAYFDNADRLNTLNKNAANNKYEILNPNLSNNIARESWRNTISAGLNWKYKDFSITAMAYGIFLDLDNRFKTNETIRQNYRYLLPGLQLGYKEFSFNYSATVNPPGITDIQPIPDNSNPLFIVNGNPELEPTRNHSFNFHYFKNVTAKTLFISAYMHGNIRENGIIRSRTVNPDGTQSTTPINVDGVQDFYTNGHINKQYKVEKFQFSIGGGYNLNYRRDYLVINSRMSYVKNFGFGPSLSASINWKDVIEWNINHYRNFNQSDYETDQFTDLKIQTNSTNTELVIRWPKNIVWETNLNYRYNSNTAPGIQKTVALLNGGVTFLFLKDQKGQLKLSGYDLLDENITVWRSTTENAIIDRQINSLQRYFLATFTYNIRTFKGGKVGGRERFFFF